MLLQANGNKRVREDHRLRVSKRSRLYIDDIALAASGQITLKQRARKGDAIGEVERQGEAVLHESPVINHVRLSHRVKDCPPSMKSQG